MKYLKSLSKKHIAVVSTFLSVPIIILLLSCTNIKSENNNTMKQEKDIATDTTFQKKKIGLIGAGWLGGTVGSLWVKSGHKVMFSSRHPKELKELAEKLGPNASIGTPKEAAEFGDILLFAVPYDAIPQLGVDLKDQIKGKIVLDACNGGSGELGKEVEKYGNGPTSQKYLAGTKLIRAFSSQDASQMEANWGKKQNKLAVPIAGNNKEAVAIAEQLVRDANCDPIIVGDLSTAVKFQRGTPGFRVHTTAAELRKLLGLPVSK